MARQWWLRLAVALALGGVAPGVAHAQTAEAISAISKADGKTPNPMRLTDAALAHAAAQVGSAKGHVAMLPDFADWVTAVEASLKTASLQATAARLAAPNGLSADAMHALLRDWLISRVGGYDLAPDGDLKAVRPAFVEHVRRDARAAGFAPFALELAAHALYVGGNCDDPALAALVADAPDRLSANWAVARGTSCPAFPAAVLADPARRTAALLLLLDSSELRGTNAMAAQTWLLDHGGLSGAAPDDVPALRAMLEQDLMGAMLGFGMDDAALARFAALDPVQREAVLSDHAQKRMVRVDGVRLEIGASDGGLRMALAAAMLNTGRRQDATALAHADPALPGRKAQVECLFKQDANPPTRQTNPKPTCGMPENEVSTAVINAVRQGFVLHALDTPDADPYPLVEVGFASELTSDTAGTMVRLRCHILTEPQYARLCRQWRASVAEQLLPPAQIKHYGSDDEPATLRAIEAAHLPGWAEAAATIEQLRSATRATFADSDHVDDRLAWSDRPPVDPDPVPFAEHPLPPALQSPEKAEASGNAWPRGWTPLPDGFQPVRTGMSGNRAVAISASTKFDPSGEVGGGAIWVHVSDNRGKTWQPPLYTGLADHFPYVVPARSRLPLLDGDTIRLEVEVQLLDTTSITYPPVGLRTRRTARNLFLELPLAALRADTDHDGLTDIAAHHLLLDRPAPLAPFLVGSDHAACAAGPAPTGVMALRGRMLLQLIGGRQEAALREPIDRPASSPPLFGWSSLPSSRRGPLFVKGDPADFACLDLPVPVLVYGAEGEAALQRETPDFRLLDAPPLIANRAGDRGFMVWSFGWTGGTTLILRDGQGWKTFELSSWIT